jgi:hypothetical protein
MLSSLRYTLRLLPLAAVALVSFGGYCLPVDDTPSTETCTPPAKDSLTLTTLDVGPSTGNLPFKPYLDDGELKIERGGQGLSMATFRLHVTGGGDPPCLPQEITLTDKLGAVILSTAGDGGVKAHADPAGGRTTNVIYVIGDLPTGERVELKAVVANLEVKRQIYIGAKAKTCSQLLPCFDTCTTSPTCGECDAGATTRGRLLVYPMIECSETECPGDPGAARETCRRNTIHGGDTGIACTPANDPHCGKCLTERTRCAADL